MQLTTINKIISYLLFGSLAVALIALHFKESFSSKLPDGAGLQKRILSTCEGENAR